MHLAEETNRSLPRSRKQNTEIAIRNIFNKRKINRFRHLSGFHYASCSRHSSSCFKPCNRKSKINMIHKRQSQHYAKFTPIIMDSKTRENKQWASHIRQEGIQNRVRSTRCISVKAIPTPGPAPSSFHFDCSNTSQLVLLGCALPCHFHLLLLLLLLLLLFTDSTTLHATPLNIGASRVRGCASHLPGGVTPSHRLLP